MSDEPPISTPANEPGVTSAELAAFFSCSTAEVAQLAHKGIIIKVARGRFDRDASAASYIKHLREQAAGRLGRNAKYDPVRENVRKKSWERKLIELRYKREANEVIDLERVKAVWSTVLRVVRQGLLGLPNKLAMRIPTLTAEDVQEVREICREILEDAATGRGFATTNGAAHDGEAQAELNGHARPRSVEGTDTATEDSL